MLTILVCVRVVVVSALIIAPIVNPHLKGYRVYRDSL